jgi:hypothetical protein
MAHKQNRCCGKKRIFDFNIEIAIAIDFLTT